MLPRTPPFNRRLASCSRSCSASPRTRWCRAACARPTDARCSSCNPTLAFLTPGADEVQLRGAVVPQRLLAAQRGRPQRHLAALHHHPDAAGPEQRGRPVVGARPTGPTERQPPAHQPVPEHGVARPAEGVRGRQRAVPGGPAPCSATCRARSRPTTEGQRAMRRRTAAGSPVIDRPDRRSVVIVVDACLPGLHEGHPVHAAVRGQRGLPVGQLDPARLAGADRRRQGRQGQGGQARRRAPTRAVVVLQIDDDGLPLHTDATAKIRPRIFLEGNFFVDLTSGSPSAPELDDGDTIKVTQTATPVQLDQVLTALQQRHAAGPQGRARPARRWRSTPSRPPAEDRDSDPSARGETAAESFNDAYDDIPDAERSTAAGARGAARHRAEPRPPRLLDGTARTTGALIRNENALQDLITNFNTTMAAFASESAQPAALDPRAAGRRWRAPTARSTSLNAAFPPTRAFAREILPGVRETPATIDAAFPWVEQARPLMGAEGARRPGRSELAPATADLAQADRQRDRAAAADRPRVALRDDVLLPTGDIVIQDEFTTGVENYKEFFYTLVGLAGEGQNFDGNGMYVRFQTGGGSQTVSLGDAGVEHGPAVRQQRRRAARQPAVLSRQALAVQAEGHLLQAEAPGPQRPGRRQVAADRRRPRPPPATRCRCCARSCARSAPRRTGRAEDRDPQAPARLRGDHRPADRRR